jgi:predicted MPP superfamily phosphohydrolase
MSYRYIIAFSVIIGFCVILDVYTWHGLKRNLSKRLFTFFKWFIPITTILFFLGFILSIYRGGQGIHNANYVLNIITGFSFGVFLAKLLIASPFIIEDFVRYTIFLIRKIKSRKNKRGVPSRRKFVRNIALSLAAVPLTGTIYAITKGKYNFQVKHRKLKFSRLPKSFEGLRIVQFSDFHAGSFDDLSAVEEGLKLINEQEPDIVVFTGDLVNNRAVEVEPYMDLLKAIKAKVGKYSILGNHDYGDYMPFPTDQEKEENFSRLCELHKAADFKLLRNESISLTSGDDEIVIGGVENWGNPPFPQYGDLKKTFHEVDTEKFKILLSHDPDHWDAEVRGFDKQIDLTLSGHTHGAQFGVDIPGWKWSPVKYRYRRWLGRYKEGDQVLYVSKGFGFLGFPGRIGMSPEIVVFDLTP